MSHAVRSERVQREIDDAIAEGWRIETETPDRVVLVKRSVGSLWVHLLLAILTAWWSWGVVNLVYGGYKYFADAQHRVVRESAVCPECGTSVTTDANYCENCGVELARAATGTASETDMRTDTATGTDVGTETDTATGTDTATDTETRE